MYEVFALSYLEMPLDHVTNTHTGSTCQDASFFAAVFHFPTEFPPHSPFPQPLCLCLCMRCNILRHIVCCGLENAPRGNFSATFRALRRTVGTVWCLAAANAVTWQTLSLRPRKGQLANRTNRLGPRTRAIPIAIAIAEAAI